MWVKYAVLVVLQCAGEPDALYTQEVPCCANPVLHAHACHSILLPPDETVADQLFGDLDESTQALRFEVRYSREGYAHAHGTRMSTGCC